MRKHRVAHGAKKPSRQKHGRFVFRWLNALKLYLRCEVCGSGGLRINFALLVILNVCAEKSTSGRFCPEPSSAKRRSAMVKPPRRVSKGSAVLTWGMRALPAFPRPGIRILYPRHQFFFLLFSVGMSHYFKKMKKTRLVAGGPTSFWATPSCPKTISPQIPPYTRHAVGGHGKNLARRAPVQPRLGTVFAFPGQDYRRPTRLRRHGYRSSVCQDHRHRVRGPGRLPRGQRHFRLDAGQVRLQEPRPARAQRPL